LTARRTAVFYRVPCITTLSGAEAAINGIESIRAQGGVGVRSLQEHHEATQATGTPAT
jgi:carbamoyl-phosphate synthase large subunit